MFLYLFFTLLLSFHALASSFFGVSCRLQVHIIFIGFWLFYVGGGKQETWNQAGTGSEEKPRLNVFCVINAFFHDVTFNFAFCIICFLVFITLSLCKVHKKRKRIRQR